MYIANAPQKKVRLSAVGPVFDFYASCRRALSLLLSFSVTLSVIGLDGCKKAEQAQTAQNQQGQQGQAPAATNAMPTALLILPSAFLPIALALFAFASAWPASALGSMFAADAANLSQAQTFVRGVILLPLLLLAISYSLVPFDLRLTLARLLDSARLPVALLVASLALIIGGIPALRQTAAKIDELRHPLSILE